MGPTRRPRGRAAQRQRWWDLLFLHWPVSLAALRPKIPAALDIDTHDGTAYVGLVPFTMTGVRPLWAPPVPGLSAFHEVNLRTYVHHQGGEPGVWFFSLDAANPVAVAVARLAYHLPYNLARMSLERGPAGEVHYRSQRRWPRTRPSAACTMTYAPTGPAAPAAPGSLEHFLAERYVLYVEHRGRLFRGRVHHAPYPLQPAQVVGLEESLLAAAGLPPATEAPLAHYAKGVSVELFALERVAP